MPTLLERGQRQLSSEVARMRIVTKMLLNKYFPLIDMENAAAELA